MGLTDQWRTIGNLKNLNPNLLFSGYYWDCPRTNCCVGHLRRR